MNKKIRNIAIIAHVDHGKTSLVDTMLHQSGVFRANQQVADRVMDSGDLERERGITILAKNTSVFWQDYKINIIDTPGHADFGGEVERVLKMVEGVLLIVDAFEGPMPQTKFVLRKAFEAGLTPIVVINKIDRRDQRSSEVADEIIELFMELGATNQQIDCPVLYASAITGESGFSPNALQKNFEPLFKTIVDSVPAPSGSKDQPLQLLVANLAHDDYIGKMIIGRVENGTVSEGQQVILISEDKKIRQRIGSLYVFEGLDRVNVTTASAGDIVAISGLNAAGIGDTVADINNPIPLESIKVDEPTLMVNFLVNDSPFSGRDGMHVTSRKLRERLFREAETNVSLRVEETDMANVFRVSGRGALHLSILIESMRREGYELQVSKPEVIYKDIDGQRYEPIELLICDFPEQMLGEVMELTGSRRGELVNMHHVGTAIMRAEFKIPARSLIGLRNEYMTQTKGEGIYSHTFFGYEPYKGDIPSRNRGSLIAFEDTVSTAYAIYHAQDRGRFFIGSGEQVYAGMIVGEHNKEQDLEINVGRQKHLTNIRAAGAEEALRLDPPLTFSLEQALEYIADDDLLEVTPNSLRMRKKILNHAERARFKKSKI